MVDVDHSASLRTICAVEQIPLHSSPISAARFHMAGLATAAPLVDASLLRPVVRVDRDAFLAAIPRAPAWIALWELRAATGLTVAAIHRELRRQIGAGRVRASVVATCWQRRRAKAEAVARASISLSAAGYQTIRAVARARGVPMRAEVDAIITAGLDAVGAP